MRPLLLLVCGLLAPTAVAATVEYPPAIINGPFGGLVTALANVTMLDCTYRDIQENSKKPWENDQHKNPEIQIYSWVIQRGNDFSLRIRQGKIHEIPDFSKPSPPFLAETGVSGIDGLLTSISNLGSPNPMSPSLKSSRSKTPWRLGIEYSYSLHNNLFAPLFIGIDFVHVGAPGCPLDLAIYGNMNSGFLRNESFAKDFAAEVDGFALTSESDGLRIYRKDLSPTISMPIRQAEIQTKAFPELKGAWLPVRSVVSWHRADQPIQRSVTDFTYTFITQTDSGEIIPVLAESLSDNHYLTQGADGKDYEAYRYRRVVLVSAFSRPLPRSALTLNSDRINLPLDTGTGPAASGTSPAGTK